MDFRLLIEQIISSSEELVDPDGTIQARLYKFQLNGKWYVLKHYFGYENREGEILSEVLNNRELVGFPRCFGYGVHKGWQFVIMNFLEGKTLAETKLLNKAQCLNLRHILWCLKYADVVHHDIRPKHIILNGDNVSLVDFGCAETRFFPSKLRPVDLKPNEKYSPDDSIAVDMIIKEFGPK